MEKKNIDWSNLDFAYMPTDKRYVSNYKDSAWDEGTLTKDSTVHINERAGVLQYAQTVFEGLKAYTTEDGHMKLPSRFKCGTSGEFALRLEIPPFPKRSFY